MKEFGSVSFVFPMYNEAPNIKYTLRKASVVARDICGEYEIIVVDDASTDGCGKIVEGIAGQDPHIKFIRLKRNTKFGGALKEGLTAASKDVIIYTDSDFPVKGQDIKGALELLEDSDIVTAYSLVIKDASIKRIVMSKVYNFLVRLLFGLSLHDINSGFKIYKKKVFEGMDLKSESPFIDAEIFIEALKRKLAISQYGLIFDLRTEGKSTISRPGIVAKTFWDMLKYKFSK